MFDIKDFYPSITQDPLNKALNFASEYMFASDGSHTWIKKQGSLFDVSMGAQDGAEVFELMGTYILNLFSKTYNKIDFELYRDNGLAVVEK